MNCAEIKKLFSPYLDGQVSGSEMRAVTRHVEQCTGCAREYAAMQRTQQLLSSLGPKKAPASVPMASEETPIRFSSSNPPTIVPRP